MKDESIIELFWSRSERAIAALTEKYDALIMKITYNITGNKADAEECANDTYLGVWNAYRRSDLRRCQRIRHASRATAP